MAIALVEPLDNLECETLKECSLGVPVGEDRSWDSDERQKDGDKTHLKPGRVGDGQRAGWESVGGST